MHSIQIDDQVFTELAQRVTGFNVTPNDVLRRVLNLPALLSAASSAKPVDAAHSLPAAPIHLPLTEFIKTERFLRNRQTVDRFLSILGWLHTAHSKQFTDVALNFQRGKRSYFARSEKEILDNGENVAAKSIPQSPLWVLTTLDNKSKRLVLEDLLRAFNYSRSDINLVLAELPDSGIRRSHDRGPRFT